MDDTKMLIVVIFFVVITGILTATYNSSVEQILAEDNKTLIGETIKWGGRQITTNQTVTFGTQPEYRLRARNETVWETVKGSEWVIIDNADFNTIFNVTEATAQQKYGTDYANLRMDAQISYENETIEKIVVPSAYQFSLTEAVQPWVTWKVRFFTDPADKGDLVLEEIGTKPSGAPAWYDLPGWLSYIWNMFSPIFTFSLFGGGVKTGLPSWVNTILSSMVSTIFYAIVILFLVKLIRGV